MSKQIKVSDEVHQRLMGAKSDAETVSDLIARMLDYNERVSASVVQPDEADRLLEQLDNKYEHPEVCLSAEDQKLFDSLEPGELPECCQEYYSNGTKCRHWHKEYVKYFGKPVLGYRNTLTGGSNYDYVNEYQQ